MPHPIEKAKGEFTLCLNKELYNDTILDKALSEDKAWVKKAAVKGRYARVRLKTDDLKEVLEWSNYLLYLNRAA